MNVVCPSDNCSFTVNSKCVFFEDATLPYSGINTNDSVQLIIQKLDAKIQEIATVGDAVWGGITGNVADQTDLITYLDTNYAPVAGSGNYWKTSGVTDILSSAVVSIGLNESLLLEAPSSGATITMNAGSGMRFVIGQESGTSVSYWAANDGVGAESILSFNPLNDLGYPSGFRFTDGRAIKTGIQYNTAGYETTDLSLISRGFANSNYWKTSGTTVLTGAVTISGNKTTFSAVTGIAQVNINGFATDPATVVNGDIWIHSGIGEFKYHSVGSTRRLLHTIIDPVIGQIPFYAGITTTVIGENEFTYTTSNNTLTVGRILLSAGTSSLAPLTIPTGVVLTAPLSGSIENDGTHIYWTDSGNIRRQLDQQSPGTEFWKTNGTTVLLGHNIIDGTGFNTNFFSDGGSYYIDAISGGEISLTAHNVANTETVVLAINNTSVVFTDNRSSLRGMEYADTGYVTQLHSFTDKEYVDAAIAAIDNVINTAAANQIAISNGDNLFGDTTFTWNPTTKRVSINNILLSAGTSTIAPLTIPTGVVLTTPLSGSIENDGTHFYWTDSGNIRRQLDQQGGITNTAAANELMKSDGTNAVPSGTFSTVAGNLTLGTGLTGGSRAVAVEGSDANIALNLFSKGTGLIVQTVGSNTASLSNTEFRVVNSGAEFGIEGSSYSSIRKSSVTNTVETGFRLQHITSAVPAAGIGVKLEFSTETSDNNFEIGGIIESVTTGVTAGSENFDIVLKAMAAGAAATEVIRFNNSRVTIPTKILIGSTTSPHAQVNLAVVGNSVAAVAQQLINTNTAGRVWWGLHEVEGTATGNFYIERFGSTHATRANEVDIVNLQNAGLSFYTNGAGNPRLVLSAGGNVGIGTSSFGTSAVKVLSISTGTAPTTSIVDGIQVFSVDSSDLTSTLGLYLEQAVEAIGTFTASHKIKVKINGTEYWIQLDAV